MTQRVLVTAGASGIGREIARSFIGAGASVFVCDIDEKALARLEQDMPGVRTAICDMGNRSDIERMMRDGIAALGGLDVLVNNSRYGRVGYAAQGVTLARPVAELCPGTARAHATLDVIGSFGHIRPSAPRQIPTEPVLPKSRIRPPLRGCR